MSKKFYAVKIGREPGVYSSWEQCGQQVNGFSGAEYKGFISLVEAENWLNGSVSSSASNQYGIVQEDLTQRVFLDEKTIENTDADLNHDIPEMLIDESDLKTCRGLIAHRFKSYLDKSDFVVSEILSLDNSGKPLEHYHRLKFVSGGFVDLYMTERRSYPEVKTISPNFSVEQKSTLKMHWRQFSVQHIPDQARQVNRWKEIEEILEHLRPYAGLKIDFIHLARAVIDASQSKVDIEEIRYDFNKIQSLVKQQAAIESD